LRRWGLRAVELGLAEEFAKTVRTVKENLQSRPLTWGDPLYHLRSLRLLIFRAIQDMLLISYGVHEEKRIVFIRQFKLVSGSPLEEQE
jgi:hypothetical protein